MHRRFVIGLGFTTLLVAGLLLSGCGGGSPTPGNGSQTNASDTKVAEFTCPMHSDVVQDKAGDCPKCGMKLVEKR